MGESVQDKRQGWICIVVYLTGRRSYSCILLHLQLVFNAPRMADVAYLLFSALAVVFNIAPLCWQIEHRNSGPICLGIWVIVANLNSLVNGIIWRNDAINRAPVFCDIAVKLAMAAPLGILASDISILMLLARVVGPGARMVSERDRRRRAIIDYAFCFGFPTFVIATHIIYQPFRFGIAKTVGCLLTLVQTWPTWVCFLIWNPLLSFIGCLLAFYVAYRLVRHRRDFKRLMDSSDSVLTTSRFARLGLLSTAFVTFNLSLSIYNLTRILPTIGPYIKYDWNYIHSDFNYVAYSPFQSQAAFSDWSNIIAGVLVMVFFGFGGEAVSYYVRPLIWLGILKKTTTEALDKDSHSLYVTQISLQHHDDGVHTDGEGMMGEHALSDGAEEHGEYPYKGPFHHIEPYSGARPQHAAIRVYTSQEAKVS